MVSLSNGQAAERRCCLVLTDCVSVNLTLKLSEKSGCIIPQKNDARRQPATNTAQPRAAREPIDLNQRLALSPREFGAALGKSATFGYRAIYRGWVKPIADCGRLMIPISEVHRFLARATEYNPQPKPKLQSQSEGRAIVNEASNVKRALASVGDLMPPLTAKTRGTAQAGSQKSHYKRLPKEFRGGEFDYRQIAREGNAAIYEQRWTACAEPSVCYEVIRIRRREGFQIGGRFVEPAEVYPRSEDWGVNGFTFTDKEAAFAKLRGIADSPHSRER